MDRLASNTNVWYIARKERNGNIKARAGRWLGFGDRAKDKMRYLCDKYEVDTQEDS